MSILSCHCSGSTGIKRFLFFVCLAFLLLLVQTGITSAADPATTAATIAVATTTSDRTGGSIYFETYPPGASIWLDNSMIGTSAFTYYSEKTGTFDVVIRKKRYENYTGTVIVSEGKRVVFSAVLTPVSYDLTEENTPAAPAVTTATTIRKSGMTIPTPWPTSPESPADPAVVIGAIALGIFVIRRR
jgi:hypothetical protein